MFEFTDKAKSNPIRIMIDGNWVAIGKEIRIERKGPQKDSIVPVASQDQLKKLFNNDAYKHLITKKEKHVKAIEFTESDPGEQQ